MSASPVEEPRPFFRSTGFKVGVGLAVLLVFVIGISQLDLRPDLHRLKVAMASGSREGNYHALVDKLAQGAKLQKGRITNVATAGTLENIQKLSAAGTKCDLQYALAQDGSDWAPGLQLVGRLPRAETVLFLGKNADRVPGFPGLANLRIGIGPDGSGTARLAHQIFDAEDFEELHVKLSNHSLAEQIALAEHGDLDLAMFVMDEDSPLISKAIRDHQLAIVGFPHAAVIAKRLPHLRTGRISAGQYDAVRMLPPDDKTVLRVDTLVISNGCANRSQTIELMTVLSQQFPDFIRHNRDTPNVTGLELASAAQTYFEHQGPAWVDEYVPWLEDLMPLGNWVYVVTAVSLLFNALGLGNKWQLWRIDADRVKLEAELDEMFPPGLTLAEISRLEPTAELRTPQKIAAMNRVLQQLAALARRARKQSLSFLVPMGQEMAYRYQENVIHQAMATLRAFLERAQRPPLA